MKIRPWEYVVLVFAAVSVVVIASHAVGGSCHAGHEACALCPGGSPILDLLQWIRR